MPCRNIGDANDARKRDLRLTEKALRVITVTALGSEQDKGRRLIPVWYIGVGLHKLECRPRRPYCIFSHAAKCCTYKWRNVRKCSNK